jgi:O-acetyl-ADP-ribose deacetylase (regulator of RNase III)
MSLDVIDGDIFSSKSQTLVNTVNCVGAMGAGIALEFKLQHPRMYQEYRSLCKAGKLDIGTLWIYRTNDRWILNFPTKRHWRQNSREEYLHAGLKSFMDIYSSEGIESIAFPLLGAQNGHLNPSRALKIMESYLIHCAIPVEIYRKTTSLPGRR